MHIPSPPINGFYIGPLFIHFYGLMYVIGIAAAMAITSRRWAARGGDTDLITDTAIWAIPAGIIGGRIYFDITTPAYIPHVWYGVLAIWDGGLGIWGGVALAIPVGAWRVRRRGASIRQFMDAVAPALLVAQGIGRIGNYFNKELFGGPTNLPWGLEVPLKYRPTGYTAFTYFHPTFLYELIWDLLLAAAIVWLGHHAAIRTSGQFALYVAGYSAFRIFEESLRIDPAQHFFGLRLNMYVATGLTLFGLIWFGWNQRHGQLPGASPPGAGEPAAAAGPAGAVDTAATADKTVGAAEPDGTSVASHDRRPDEP